MCIQGKWSFLEKREFIKLLVEPLWCWALIKNGSMAGHSRRCANRLSRKANERLASNLSVNSSGSSLHSFPCFLEVTTLRPPETSRGAHDSELCGQHFVDEGEGMSHNFEGFAGLKHHVWRNCGAWFEKSSGNWIYPNLFCPRKPTTVVSLSLSEPWGGAIHVHLWNRNTVWLLWSKPEIKTCSMTEIHETQ